MHSFLIISSDKKQREQYARELCQKEAIDQFDISIVESEKALGIEDVREMQQKIFLKPLKSKQKAVILRNAHTATKETQNALLKLLEEPPANTLVMLTAATENAFLPTIISRCKVVRLQLGTENISKEDLDTLQAEFENLVSAEIGEKLKFAQDLAKDKEKAIEWLKSMIKVQRIAMLNNSEQADLYIPVLQNLQKAYTSATSTNVNIRFLLEDMILTMSSIIQF